MSDKYLSTLSSYRQSPMYDESLYSGKCILTMYEDNCTHCGECIEYGIKGKE